jgi:hypothetical protein
MSLCLAARSFGQTAPGLPLTPPPSPNVSVSADLSHYEEAARHWLGMGHVRITYKKYTLTGDSGDYDVDASLATLRGNVELDTGREVVSGGSDGVLSFNVKTREWNLNHGTTNVLPQGALSPFHVSAESLAGTRQVITLRGVRLTSCDPANPQYELTAREADIYPDKKVVARNATTYLFGHRLATVPVVVLPVREQSGRAPVVPVVGESTEEGFYLKTSINYIRSGSQTGAVKVDLLQKQGLGLGIVQDYAAGGKGEVSLYTVTGQNGHNLTANVHDKRTLFGFTTQVDGELRRNSYLYVPGTTSRNGGVTLQRIVGASNTRISLRYDGSQSGTTKYQSVVSAFSQTYQFNPKGTIQFSLDNSRQAVEGAASTGELDHKLTVSQGLNAVDLEIDANHITTHGGGADADAYLPVQRLPEFTVKTDAYRLGLTESKSAPVALTVADGSFQANGVRGGRELLDATAPNRRWSAGSLTLNVGGGFRQAIYSSDAALYTLSANVSATQPLGRKSDFTLAYSISQPRGYTPFQFDRPFAYNSLSGTLKVADIRGLEFRAGTAYDFKNDLTPWRDVLGVIQYAPSDAIHWVTNVAVNVNGLTPTDTSRVRYVNSGLRLRLGAIHFDGEARYTPGTGRFGRLLENLDTPIGRDWRFRTLAGTDNGQHYRHVMLVKDMGCTEASVALVNDQGWRNETGFRVLLRIKAFPMADPFTTGMFGENLNIGGGDLSSYGGTSAPPGAPGL